MACGRGSSGPFTVAPGSCHSRASPLLSWSWLTPCLNVYGWQGRHLILSEIRVMVAVILALFTIRPCAGAGYSPPPASMARYLTGTLLPAADVAVLLQPRVLA